MCKCSTATIGKSGVSGGDGGSVSQVRAACNGQRVASSGQQAAGGARAAGREQSGVGGGPERPNKFQKFLAPRFPNLLWYRDFVPRNARTKICTMFLVPDRVIFAGPGSLPKLLQLLAVISNLANSVFWHGIERPVVKLCSPYPRLFILLICSGLAFL